jgi:hypothetical protein
MKKFTRIGVVASAFAASFAMAAPAMATPPSGSTGFDEQPNVVNISGSDTSFAVSGLISGLYNGSEGCDTSNTVAQRDRCKPTVASGVNDPNDVDGWRQSTGTKFANWDHDQALNVYPIGSGAGRTCLDPATAAQCDIQPDLARSSSGIGNAALFSNWAFGSEQIAVVAVNPAVKARSGTLGVTLAQLQTIYSTNAAVCNTVSWAALGDTGANSADIVVGYGMNSGSGTFGVFNTYLGTAGLTNSSPCHVGEPFENDVEELNAGPAANVALFNSGNGIWWMSGATYKAFPVLKKGLTAINVDGQVFGAAAYPAGLSRTVSYVARDTDVAWTGTTIGGAGAGKAGASREFIRFLCNNSLATGILDRNEQKADTGTNVTARVASYLTATGFTQIAVANRNFGRCTATT